MKTNKPYKVKTSSIRSMKDLEAEKTRLMYEIRLKEEHILGDYHRIVEALTFRNLASTALKEVSATSTVLSRAFSLGKMILEKRKKKKKEKLTGES